MEESLNKIDQQVDARARTLDPIDGSIRPGNESVVLEGDPGRVIFLLHGFLSSPFEVRPLGEALNRLGYTIFMPLLAGFGRSTTVAACTDSQDWMMTTLAQIKATQIGGRKIHIIGFSLGALLETKILLENPSLRENTASLTLISPALFLKRNSMMDIGEAILQVFNPTPSIPFIAMVARNDGNLDMEIPERFPEYYNSDLPVAAVQELKSLAASIDYSLFSDFHIPLKIIYSESDQTIDGPAAISAISAFKPNLSTYVIPEEQTNRHQILLSGNSRTLGAITDAVIENFS